MIVESIVVHNSDWPTGTQVICTLDAPVVSQAARTDIHDSFVRILAVNPEVVSQVNLYTSNYIFFNHFKVLILKVDIHYILLHFLQIGCKASLKSNFLLVQWLTRSKTSYICTITYNRMYPLKKLKEM